MNCEKLVKFTINGVEHEVNACNVAPETTLNTYLRQQLLTGTKRMCLEGGCGACIVTIERPSPLTGKCEILACLIALFSCNGWRIETVEGLGDCHPIQSVLAQFNGTQCGFCSPGMVMNMYGLCQKDRWPTMAEVESAFGGNICRCTGYRPILAAFKSICTDASADLIGIVPDLEDLQLCKNKCSNLCQENLNTYYYKLRGKSWIKVFQLYDLLKILNTFNNTSYMLVAGNTSKGVYRTKENFDIYIDISNIKELQGYKLNGDTLILGANTTLTDAMVVFQKIETYPNFSYLKKVREHIDLIANVPVRNLGTLAGNLMIKYNHHEFPSDIFLVLETVGATLTLVDADSKEINLPPRAFLTINMEGKVLKNITWPALGPNFKYESYKIMPRSQNAHALVNAGFLLQLDDGRVKSAHLVFGCINPTVVHASKTERILIGRNLFDNNTLQAVFAALNSELVPDVSPPEPSPKFRKQLAIALFFKFVLSIAPDGVISARNRSGGDRLMRPISSGTQDYETNESLYPLGKAIPKIEALAQTSGQAEYIMDMPDRPDQLFAAFVLAKVVPLSKLVQIDATGALKLDGVIAFFDKNDIPGRNTFMPKEANFTIDEEIFCSGTVQYFGQPVGLVVARSSELAQKAADLVRITYKAGEKYYLTIQDILDGGGEVVEDTEIKPKCIGKEQTHVVKGQFEMSWQYHYHMETQCCNVIPTEDGLDVYPSSQWIDLSQTAIATTLNIPLNRVNIFIRRLGGGFGAKISRNSLISCAAALAAFKLQKPIKLWMPFETNMDVIGKRYPVLSKYEAAIDNNGIIQYLENTFYSDYGSGGNEPNVPYILDIITSCYNIDTWHVKANVTKSNTPANCYIRAPGTCEGLAMIESIMEHIAMNAGLDPLEFRVRNLKQNHNQLHSLINDLENWASIKARKLEISRFNENNQWKKKGLAVVPMIYRFHLFGNYGVIVSIYHADGSVAIAHGGVEMGQGINTKVAQVCAFKLGIPMEKISIKPSNNLIAPNAHMTGGSLTSEGVCYGVMKACDQLLERMKPVRESSPDTSWEDLVKICSAKFVNLSATSMSSPADPNLKNYPVYGVCAAEIALDVLTGQHLIVRIDLIEDTGRSLSPQIDVGQVEGAFVMGIGYFTTEQIVIDTNGRLLTNRTWNYKPPGAKDVPVDFRIKFPKGGDNPVGVLKSKATAEPPICLACSVPLAIRNAVASARFEANNSAPLWYPFEGPSTVENTFMNCLHDFKQYKL